MGALEQSRLCSSSSSVILRFRADRKRRADDVALLTAVVAGGRTGLRALRGDVVGCGSEANASNSRRVATALTLPKAVSLPAFVGGGQQGVGTVK